jgi:uroporphyrinogen-III decarboxylase
MVQYAAENAKRDGGYIFGTSHNIQADTSMDNVVALFEAYHEYGVY